MLKPAFLERASQLEAINEMVEVNKRGFYLLEAEVSVGEISIVGGMYLGVPCTTIKQVKSEVEEIEDCISELAEAVGERYSNLNTLYFTEYKLSKKEIPTQDSNCNKPYKRIVITLDDEELACVYVYVMYVDRPYPIDD